MKDTQEVGRAPPEQNIFPDALAEPEGELLRAVFPGALFVSRLARAPGGWRTLSRNELDALDLTLEQQEAVLALQTLTQLSYPTLPKHAITNSAMVASVYGHRLGGLVHEVMLAIAPRRQEPLPRGAGSREGGPPQPVRPPAGCAPRGPPRRRERFHPAAQSPRRRSSSEPGGHHHDPPGGRLRDEVGVPLVDHVDRGRSGRRVRVPPGSRRPRARGVGGAGEQGHPPPALSARAHQTAGGPEREDAELPRDARRHRAAERRVRRLELRGRRAPCVQGRGRRRRQAHRRRRDQDGVRRLRHHLHQRRQGGELGRRSQGGCQRRPEEGRLHARRRPGALRKEGRGGGTLARQSPEHREGATPPGTARPHPPGRPRPTSRSAPSTASAVARTSLPSVSERSSSERTGKHQLRELTRRQASALLSELSNLNGAHA